MRELAPWPEIEPGPLVSEVWSLSHWNTREPPSFIFLMSGVLKTIFHVFCHCQHFKGWEIRHNLLQGRTSLVAQTVKHLPTVFNPCVGKISWRRKWHPTPILLPGKSHGWRSLVGYSPWGSKELDTTKRLHFHCPAGKGLKEFVDMLYSPRLCEFFCFLFFVFLLVYLLIPLRIHWAP